MARTADKDREDCAQVVDQDRSIAGCTKILARGDAERPSNRAFAYGNRGNAYANKGDYDRAIRDFDEAIRLNPKLAVSYHNRGWTYARKGDYDRAIRDYDAAIRLDPKFALAYYSRGAAYYSKGDDDTAIRDANEAIRLDPKDGDAYGGRGFAFGRKGDYDSAIRDLDKAIRLGSGHAITYFARGVTYLKKGDYDHAIHDFDEAIRLDPNHREARAAREHAVKALAAVRPEPAAGATSAGASLFETRVALVIGNARYAAQSPLKNPQNDAAAIAAALRGAGFRKVVSAADLSRDALVKALQEFQAEADRADWAVIYFSGHGVEIGGVNYVVPTDARLVTDRNAPDEAVSLDRLEASVGGARKLRIVILDSCRNNPYLASMQRTIAYRSAGKGLAPVEPTRATLVVYAARDGQLAQDGAGDNSPFAAALARRLGEPHVEVLKLFRLVTDDVLDATGNRQQPFVYGSLPGREDFYFRP